MTNKHNYVKMALGQLQTELRKHSTVPPHPIPWMHTHTNTAASRTALPPMEMGAALSQNCKAGDVCLQKRQ